MLLVAAHGHPESTYEILFPVQGLIKLVFLSISYLSLSIKIHMFKHMFKYQLYFSIIIPNF